MLCFIQTSNGSLNKQYLLNIDWKKKVNKCLGKRKSKI